MYHLIQSTNFPSLAIFVSSFSPKVTTAFNLSASSDTVLDRVSSTLNLLESTTHTQAFVLISLLHRQ